MDLLFPISNEAEFQEWLVSVLESERKRLLSPAAPPKDSRPGKLAELMNFAVETECFGEGDTES